MSTRSHNTTPVRAAVIGAGPYGLSVAAHLTAAGIPHRVFGEPMGAWARHMPAGMHLKSTPDAVDLCTPEPAGTFSAFCQAARRAVPSEQHPIPLEHYVDYGRWFQQRFVGHLERTAVALVRPEPEGFEVKLATGEAFHSSAVVVACGFAPFATMPRTLAPLTDHHNCAGEPLLTHSSEHAALDGFAGRTIALIGAGQAALETAALLHEHGATVHVLVRSGDVRWGGPPTAGRGRLWHLVKPRGGLGDGWSNYAAGRWPGLVRHLPERLRLGVLDAVLGPSGSWWLRPRVELFVTVHTATEVRAAAPMANRLRLDLAASGRGERPAGAPSTLEVDHVIACTGYQPDLRDLPFLDPDLAAQVRTAGGWPVLDRGFQSTVPGLHFAGLASAGSFGPVMRFVYGCGFAARRIAAALGTTC